MDGIFFLKLDVSQGQPSHLERVRISQRVNYPGTPPTRTLLPMC